ncbi:MAG TPA: ABC transporter ATP-binding protein [Nitrospinota bacterium]|mgnify:CR=1 FL=1|nr:ABC transporter ATP-binding protein [Nitrospinota bacterium]|tara:strand:- start:68766 stop:69470 length:705 start_codon:yes stop_codon:yes gene_type:complete
MNKTASPYSIVSLSTVSKIYKQGKIEVKALDRVTLKIKKGEFSAISGPSGSGKTTLLNLVGALDTPTSGSVTIEGIDLSELTKTELSILRRNRIGFVFQAYNLIPVLTAFENAEFVLALQGIPEAQRRRRVMGVLHDVGLSGMEHRKPDELSGGQQQRVAIARAIVPEPAIVLADEPTANIDSGTADSLLDLMQLLNKEKQITFLFSTHDNRVMERAKRLITMRDGIVSADEEP